MKLVSIPIKEAEAKVLDTGLLYLINRTILHRVGLAMAFVGEDADNMTRIEIMKADSGDEQIHFDPEFEKECWEKLQRFLDERGQGTDSIRLVFETIFVRS